MATRRISVTIGPDGKIRATTLGIEGKACLDYIPLLEDLLDAEVVESAFTPEYTAATPATIKAAVTATAAETVHEQES